MTTAESGVFLDPNLDGIQGDMPHPTVAQGENVLDLPPYSRAALISSDDLLPGSEIFSQMLKAGVVIDHSLPRENAAPIANTHLKTREQMDIVFRSSFSSGAR